MTKFNKNIADRGYDDYQHLSVDALDSLGKHIFNALPEIKNKHPEVVEKYYQSWLDDYQKDQANEKMATKHTEKLDNATYQRLNWLKKQNCGFYHDIISRAVLMVYVLYRADLADDNKKEHP